MGMRTRKPAAAVRYEDAGVVKNAFLFLGAVQQFYPMAPLLIHY
jgi:hypothetical protein